MINFLKKIIKKELDRRNFMIMNKADIRLEVLITPKDKVEALIKKLRPYNTEIELIRLGPNGDGGYLVPNDLEEIYACFSPGVAQVSQFENDCYEKGMKLFLADKSVVKPNLNLPNTQYSFLKKFVGCTNNSDFITMDEWVKQSAIKNKSDLLLQMDIEEGEYNTLINISDALINRFRIIVIEFHNLHSFWNYEFYKIANTVFDKILQTHTCVHIHPNNCCGEDIRLGVSIPRVAEFTFLRNDRVSHLEPQKNFPHKLDYDNTKKPHLSLPKNWYD